MLDLNNKIKAYLGSTENMFFFLCNAVAKCSNILAFFGVSENTFNQLPDVSFAFAEFFWEIWKKLKIMWISSYLTAQLSSFPCLDALKVNMPLGLSDLVFT